MIKIRRVWDESVKDKQKSLDFKAFPVYLDALYMDLGGFLILKEIKNIEI